MKELLRQIAGDVQAIRRAYAAQVAQEAIERGLKETAERNEMKHILCELVMRGVITNDDANKAWEKIKEGATEW